VLRPQYPFAIPLESQFEASRPTADLIDPVAPYALSQSTHSNFTFSVRTSHKLLTTGFL
jgi:hypothetical protein